MRVYPSEIKSDTQTGWLDLTGLGVESKPAGSSGVFNYTVLLGKQKIKLRCLYCHESDCINTNLKKDFI